MVVTQRSVSVSTQSALAQSSHRYPVGLVSPLALFIDNVIIGRGPKVFVGD